MKTIKVFKTNVDEHSQARSILEAIRKKNPGSDPSFDLEDCDKVLRVENPDTEINEDNIRKIFQDYGYKIERLSLTDKKI